MSDFTWATTIDQPAQFEYRMLTIQMGDGYIQEIPDGINYKTASFQVSTRLYSPATIATIEAFLDSKHGNLPFTWTPNGGAEEQVVCKKYTRVPNPESATMLQLQMTFERRYLAP
jgi:phage-related protein